MSEHPILFTSEIVRAILDGRKTQTRRVPVERYRNWKVGDTLWVRESFAIFDVDGDEDIAIGYKADDTYKTVEWFKDKRKEFGKLRLGKWRSSLHLHRWAARIFLEITGLRDERVQDISWRDCKAEGIILIGDELVFNNRKQKHSLLRTKFNRLWDSINAKRHNGIYAWPKNPVVKVIEFKKEVTCKNQNRTA
ncbi:MAG: hypothetical protein IIC00_15790 [Planctomycetes bacterium]|nr:hypothetical protein [Planctomycetota bacterium]